MSCFSSARQVGLAFAAYLFYTVSQISLVNESVEGESEALVKANKASDEELFNIYQTIQEGASAFLWAEYQICFIFIAGH